MADNDTPDLALVPPLDSTELVETPAADKPKLLSEITVSYWDNNKITFRSVPELAPDALLGRFVALVRLLGG